MNNNDLFIKNDANGSFIYISYSKHVHGAALYDKSFLLKTPKYISTKTI